MLPSPLHPAVIHFPIVLMILLPLFAAGAMWTIRRGANTRRAWLLPVVLAGALSASTFVAVRTGEADGERVEKVVPERAVERHEEAAERFLLFSGILLAVSAFGLMRGNVGSAARVLTTVGAIGLVVVGVQVGSAGGELVYVHNAARVHAAAAAGVTAVPVTNEAREHNEGP